MSQKGTALSGAAIADDVLASSDSIFTKNQYGGQKGLQQFFSPRKLSDLAAAVFGKRLAVLDPTAGDGSLLAAFDKPFSFGIEIDADQVEASGESYHPIRGDLQHVFPLVRRAAPEFDGIVMNPPFGLMWSDPTYRGGRPTNSAVLTLVYANQMLTHNGQFVFVCGLNRFHRQIARLPEARGIYAVVECHDLFVGTAEPAAIAFGVNPGIRKGEGFVTRECPREMLDLLAAWVKEARDQSTSEYVSTASFGNYAIPQAWTNIQAEYVRRTSERFEKREFDLELFGGDKLNVLPSAFATVALQKVNELGFVNGLRNHSIHVFAHKARDWNKLLALEAKGIIRIQPRLRARVEETLADIRKELVPLYPVKKQQRLGFLSDEDHLLCTASDPERGFVAGEFYRLDTQTETVVRQEQRVEESKKTPGEYVERTYTIQKKAMKITVGHWSFTDTQDDEEHIRYLIDHFDLPDPGDAKSRHPETLEAIEALLHTILDEMFIPNSRAWEAKNPDKLPFVKEDFQIEDIARLIFKGKGLLSWEQGLGKTVGGLLYAEGVYRWYGCQDARLIVTAKDLIDQWQRETERFYGFKATLIRTHAHAKKVARFLREGGEGLYITYYEALSIVGMRGRNVALPPIVVEEKEEITQVPGTGRYGYFYVDPESGVQTPSRSPQWDVDRHEYRDTKTGVVLERGYIEERWDRKLKQITSKELCPSCRADTRSGWNGMFCRAELDDGSRCGYAHYKVRLKPIGSFLSQAFTRGVIVADEITLIQGDSLRSEAFRGLRCRHPLGMTGTPIKNFVGQAFWLLWWCLGNGSKRFGYTYKGGKVKFEEDFSVVEWKMNGAKKENRAVLPDVTNLSYFWRMTASSCIRRRKEETGRPFPPRYYHEVKVPLGLAQFEQYRKWLKDFPELFAEKYPDAPIVAAGLHGVMAPMLGLNWKLDFALTLPEADKDAAWTGVEGVSNFTPANLRVLELALALSKKGRKVLIGSNLIQPSRWFAERLQEKGVNAIHILDSQDTTATPEQRAKRVYAFQSDDVQVFCVGVNALRLGHDLGVANAVILNGLDWSFDTLDQFINRVHRFTSKQPVDVYVILPANGENETLTTRKWDILGQKGDAADLALDGKLSEKAREQVEQAEVIRDLMRKGVKLSGDEVIEEDVERAWSEIPNVDAYEPPEDLLPHREEWVSPLDACAAVGEFIGFFSRLEEVEAKSAADTALAWEELDACKAVAAFIFAAHHTPAVYREPTVADVTMQAIALDELEEAPEPELLDDLAIDSLGESEVFGEDESPEDEPDREPEGSSPQLALF